MNMYGKQPVLEALSTYPHLIKYIFCTGSLDDDYDTALKMAAREHGIQMRSIPEKELAKRAGNSTHQNVVAELREFPFVEFQDWVEAHTDESHGFVVVLSHVKDPHNVGAIIRSAAGLGARAVFLPKDNQAAMSPTVIKVSAGAVFHVPIIQVPNVALALRELAKLRYWSCALDGATGENLTQADLVSNIAFIAGSEESGVQAKVLESADMRVAIPLANNIESFNVSVATAIGCYEWVRQNTA